MKCTYCGGTKFLEGPSGGMSTNVLCANPECRHWFNSSPFSFDDLHRIEPTDEEKTEAARKKVDEESAVTLATYRDGADLYRQGEKSLACLKDQTYGPAAEVRSNVIRLCGWLDASQGRDR